MAGCFAFFRFLDWLVGKIGYLGIFTSPEDFQAMMARAPVWLQSVWESMVLPALIWLGAAWEFVASPIGTVTAFALIALVLVVDMDKVARLTRGLWFNVRHAVAEKMWIDGESALNLLRDSEWGQLVGPSDVTYFNALSSLGSRFGLSESEKKRIKFRRYLFATLRKFAESNPDAYKEATGEGDSFYDEVALRDFIDAALDALVEGEFGKPPDFRVTPKV